MADINLIPSDELLEKASSKRQTRALSVAIIFLVVVSAATTVLFFIWAISVSQINAEVSKQNQLAGQIDTYVKNEKINKFVVDQAQIASQALGEQINFQSVMSNFRSLLPDGVKLTDFSSSAQSMVISGSASNSVALSTFISKSLEETQKSEGHIASVSLTTLTGRDDGTFQFSVTMALKNTKIIER